MTWELRISQGWEIAVNILAFFVHRVLDWVVLLKVPKVWLFRIYSCFWKPTGITIGQKSEPSRTLGWGKGGEGKLVEFWDHSQKEGSTPSRRSSRNGCAKALVERPRCLGGGRAPLALWDYCLGKAKSQAVSCAHFHMACMRRVKPMSLGFSRPLISRCFMMETNSLLLSSPLPRGRGRHNRDR